jgi:hypothetical protein
VYIYVAIVLRKIGYQKKVYEHSYDSKKISNDTESAKLIAIEFNIGYNGL